MALLTTKHKEMVGAQSQVGWLGCIYIRSSVAAHLILVAGRQLLVTCFLNIGFRNLTRFDERVAVTCG
jgi:hypothetical protein